MLSWGIDTSSKAVHVVAVNEDEKIIKQQKFVSKDINSDKRLVSIYDQLLYYLDVTPEIIGNVVTIESPIYIQNAASTVMLAKMVAAAQLAFREANLVGNTTWKKFVLGSGRASKDEIRKWAEEFWRIKFIEQDFADAACIALYGLRKFIPEKQMEKMSILVE